MSPPLRLLILGGTTEASRLAAALASEPRIAATLSYAGRVASPRAQPTPTRIGGFGGVAGLAAYLREERIGAVIDATHPFASRMSASAVAACAAEGVPLVALERAPWAPQPGDRWREVGSLEAAAELLARRAPETVFLAVGRLHLATFARAARHRYLLRLVDPPAAPLPLPLATVIVGRGPFDADADTALLREHRVRLVVAKNAGGEGASAKLVAARALGLEVILTTRPAIPPRPRVESVEAALAWLETQLAASG